MLQSILESAEARQRQAQDGQDFLTLLMQQTFHDLQLTSIVLWQTSRDDSVVLAQMGTTTPTTQAVHEVTSVRPGEVVQAASGSPAESGASRFLAASTLAASLNLVLDVVTDQTPPARDLLMQLADVFADLQRRRLLDRHVAQMPKDRTLNVVIAQLHASLDSEVVANIVATDGAALLECRRVSVVRRNGRHWDVVATTGVSQPNARSDAARQICEWVTDAEHAAADPEPGTAQPNTAQRSVHPLEATLAWPQAHWAAVFEFDAAQSQERSATQKVLVDRLCHHATLALANCDRLAASTLAGQLGRGLKSLTRPRTSLLLISLLVFVSAMVFIPRELRIEVYGELVPTQRTFVFAPDDGVISQVAVEDGSQVAANAPLCRLTNEDLEVQREAIDGELASANARLAAIDAMRGGRTSGPDASAALLSAEQVELTERVASLAKQAKILNRRLAKLTVTSHQAGRVYGDRLQQMLFQRPVQRGQFLFEVANPEAGWQLDLRIPETDVRHVLQAREQADASLRISYALETSPETSRDTELQSVGLSTDANEQGTLTTLATAIVSESEFQTERPGAGVVAYIHCGPRSLGYVWFRKLIEFVQRRL